MNTPPPAPAQDPAQLRNERMLRWLEIYKGMIQISVEGFRISALANGGAAVALLTFLGSDGGSRHAQAMMWPMACFLFGLLLCAFSIICAYNNHGNFAREIDPDEALARGRDGRKFRKKVRRARRRQLWLARTAFALSMVAFAAGAGLAVFKFDQQFEATEAKPAQGL